jgi:N-acetylglucosamine kinase-like BadF-type ATPase
MEEAGKELVFSAKKVIEKLNFKNEEFPIVLIGRVFESEIVLKIVKKEIKKIAPKAKFLVPQIKIEPVVGAVKLAIENLKTC